MYYYSTEYIYIKQTFSLYRNINVLKIYPVVAIYKH